MDPVGPGLIRFRIHAPVDARGHADEDVSASVFAAKLGALVRALKAADRAANGAAVHDYKIRKLQSSSPTALIAETPISRTPLPVASSGIEAFEDCATAVKLGNHEQAQRFGRCAAYISQLGKGARKTFAYAEIWPAEHEIIRVDPFLAEQAKAAVSPGNAAAPPASRNWYKGAAIGTFDGTIQAVDLRGALPEVKLVLSAGGKELDCICREDDVETIRSALNRRVRLSGRAIYDGKSGLPRRIEVSSIEPIRTDVDFSRWKGAFRPFDLAPWEGDEN